MLDSNQQKTIFFTISTPIAVRNFFLVPGGVLDSLRKHHVKVVVLVTEQAYEEMNKDFGAENVIIEPTVIYWNKTFSQRIVDFFTRYLNFTDLMRSNATNKGTRIDISYDVRKRFTYFVKASIAATLGRSSWIRNVLAPRLSFFVYHTRPYRYLFDKYKPDLVFVSSALADQGLEVLREAKRQGVYSIGMSESWDHFPKRYEPIRPNRILVWHETSGNEAVTLQDYKKKEVHVVGAPQYDLFSKKEFLLSRDEFFSKCGLDSNKKLVTLFSSTIYSPDDKDIVKILLDFLINKQSVVEYNLFIRPYPGAKYEQDKFSEFDRKKGIYVDWVESKNLWGTASHRWYPDQDGFIWTINILFHSDIIINTYSSVSIEASAFLKPIININFDGYKKRPPEKSIKRFEQTLTHFKHVLKTDAVRQANSEQELLQYLNEFFNNPDANRSNVEKLRTKMCGTIDGKAGQRIVEHIMKML
mgnify:CR=1 FL=1